LIRYEENRDIYTETRNIVLDLGQAYTKHPTQAFEGAKRAIEDMDVKNRLLQSLRNGYCGFEVFNHKFLTNMSESQSRFLFQISRQKIRNAGLSINEEETILFPRLLTNSLIFALCRDLTDRIRPPNVGGQELVIHESL